MHHTGRHELVTVRGGSWAKGGMILSLVTGLVALIPTFVWGEVTGPDVRHRHVTYVITQLMRQEHLSKRPIDDEISQRALKTFIQQLDPMKIYFLQTDIDEFAKYRTSIDDYVKSGDTKVAYTIFARFLQRVDERTAEIDELLDLNHDFTLNEQLVVDPDVADFAASPAEARELWRKRIKYELLFRKADEVAVDEAKEQVERRYKSIAKRKHQTDSNELLEMFLTSVTSSFDPHTTYMSPDSHTNFEINMRLNLDGIGAALEPDDGYTVVKKIIPGGAADKQGELEPGDKIVSVGQGNEGDMVDVVDMKLSDVVKLIRGRAGTMVRLGVTKAESTKTKEVLITRARIELKDSEARGDIIERGSRADGKPYRIGVIDLPSFYMDMEGARNGAADFKSTTRDVRRILDDFSAKNVDVVVLDLRRNGGGSLTEAINLTGLFIDTGPIVQVKDSDGHVLHYDDNERGMAWSGPLVVATSRFSASASEILAGAIQDYQRGIIVGDESTHGKGTVQSLLDLGDQLFRVPDPPNMGALKITMQQFYRPNGDSTQKRGVLSDVVLPSITNEMEGISESDLDYAIEFDRVNSAMFTKYDRVSADVVAGLKARSRARRVASEDFSKLERNLNRYREQKAKKSVTLNEAEFLKEREELDADKEEEKTLEDQMDQLERPVVEDTFYFREILAIAEDYVELEAQGRVAAIN